MRLVLHEDPRSGNCYKIRLTAALVGLPIERRAYDIMKGETRTPGFLANVSPNGRIPVLQIDDWFLPESNAACAWLAHGTALFPDDRNCRADMLRWMFWEQYNHEPNIATMRFLRRFVGTPNLTSAQAASIPAKLAGGGAALRLMDDHLSRRPWMTSDRATLADICLFAYTHLADEGGFVLADHPHIQRWCADVRGLPGFIPVDA